MAQRVINGEQYEAYVVRDEEGGSLTIDGRSYRSSATITRPSDTTAYTAKDVIGDTGGSAVWQFTNAGSSGGYVLVQSVELLVHATSVPSGMAAFRLHLYSESPTAIADNAAFDLVSGDRAIYLGFVDISTPEDMGSTLYNQSDYPGRLLKLATGSTSLYAQLETKGAFTPGSATVYELRIKTLEAGL